MRTAYSNEGAIMRGMYSGMLTEGGPFVTEGSFTTWITT